MAARKQTMGDRGEVRFQEAAANGRNYVALRAPASVAGDVTFSLPGVDGGAGTFLKTDGAGNLTFGSSAAASLDTAYDNGVGITVDAGAVTLTASAGNVALDIAAGNLAIEGELLTKGPVFNVKHPDYGATGDGTTDDRAAIQSALAAAGAASPATVLFPPGTYRLATYQDATNKIILELQSGVSIQGVGDASVIKLADGMNVTSSNSPKGVFFSPNAGTAIDNVVYRDLKFDMNGTNNEIASGQSANTKNACIGIENGSNITLCRINVTDNAGRQCFMFGSDPGGAHTVTNLRILNCTITEVGNAASSGTNQYQTDHSAIYAQANGCVIANNRIVNTANPWLTDNAINGTAIECHSSKAVVCNNTIDKFRNGINVVATQTDQVDSVYANNLMTGVNTFFSFWNASSRTLSGIRVVGNICEQADFSTAENPIETGNIVTAGTFTDLTLEGNQFRSLSTKTTQSPPPHSLEMRYMTRLTVRGNEFRDLIGRAISLSLIDDNCEAYIQNNVIIDCAKTTVSAPANDQAIDLNHTTGTAFRNLVITGNVIKNTSTVHMATGIGGNVDIDRGLVANNYFDNVTTAYAFDGTIQNLTTGYPIEWANVRDFGAKGDWNGSAGTDDAAAIQAAIDYVGKGVVYFPPGRYRILSAINPDTDNHGLTLMGSSSYGSTCEIVVDFAGVGIDVDCLNLKIENLEINGKPDGATKEGTTGIQFATGNGSVVRNVRISGFTGNGVEFTGAGSSNGVLFDSVVSRDNDGDGFSVPTRQAGVKDYVTLLNCTSDSNGDEGVYITGDYWTIIGGYYEGNTGNGIEIGDGTNAITDTVLINPLVTGNTAGQIVHAANSTRSNVTGDRLSLGSTGAKLTSFLTGSTTWDPGSINNSAVLAQDVTVTGAALGDFAMASLGVDVTDLVVSASVTATNTVTVVLSNNTASPIDLGSSTVKVFVFKE